MDAHSHAYRSDRIWSMSSVLTKEPWTCVQLVYVEELTQAEVAREVGLTQRMVSTLLSQAYDRMQKHFADHGYVPPIDFDPQKN